VTVRLMALTQACLCQCERMCVCTCVCTCTCVCEGATCMFVDGYGSWPSRKPACVNVSVGVCMCVYVYVCVKVRHVCLWMGTAHGPHASLLVSM